MSPELFLFGIPAIAQYGFKPHDQAITLLKNYLEYHRNLSTDNPIQEISTTASTCIHQLPEQERLSYYAKMKRLYSNSYQRVRSLFNQSFCTVM